ncbi:MAG: diguanylate cyclase [Acidobacteria bacterium]|nr:diguanylate cyclase [Acidobacteriota bacterium]
MATPARSRLVASELPGRVEAESDLRARFHAHRRCYAAVILVDRLELIERRLGAAAASQCLTAVAVRLSRLLQPRDRFYRWSGRAFLLLLDRTAPLPAVSAEVRECLAVLPLVRLENSALRLACSSSVFAVDDIQSPAALVRKIELFLGTTAAS